MKKSLWVLVATIGLVATFMLSSSASSEISLPGKKAMKKADHTIPPATLLTPTFSASSANPLCQTTGFEPSEQAGICQWPTNAWMCSPKACASPAPAGCSQACRSSCPNLSGWYISGSSVHCNYPSVETTNPAPGGSTQHMRLFRDPAIGQGDYIVNGAGPLAGTGTRQTAFTPTVAPHLPEPFTYSVDVAQIAPGQTPPFGSSFAIWALADVDASGLTGLYLYWHYYGILFVADYSTGLFEGLGYVPGGGAYTHLDVAFDPCAGSITYTMDGGTPYVTSLGPGQAGTVQRFIIGNNNIGSGHDVDNMVMNRSGQTCPTTCGDNQVTLGAPPEQCDGTDDGCCPGRCIPAGQDGQCTCTPADNLYDGCPASARVLTNGDNGPFLHDGGLYSYTADTPFTSINTCGSDYDTEIIWDLYNNCNEFAAYNDECENTTFGGTQVIGDPSAPCFGQAGDTDSCMCLPTEPGRTYVFLVGEYGFTLVPAQCSTTQVSILKKATCGAPIEGGACCDRVSGTCSQVADEADCSGDNQIFSFNKTCDLVTCEAALGACCNTAPGAGGACADTTSANCATNQYTSWNKDVACADYDCNEVTGACCDGLSGTCTDNVLQAACNCSHCSWSVGASCSTVACFPATGACCDTGSVDPTVATCTTTTLAACNCSKCTWTKGESCDNVVCDPNFTPIPTVSEWGLVIMALLLLVGGKVYFGRRQTAMA